MHRQLLMVLPGEPRTPAAQEGLREQEYEAEAWTGGSGAQGKRRRLLDRFVPGVSRVHELQQEESRYGERTHAHALPRFHVYGHVQGEDGEWGAQAGPGGAVQAFLRARLQNASATSLFYITPVHPDKERTLPLLIAK